MQHVILKCFSTQSAAKTQKITRVQKVSLNTTPLKCVPVQCASASGLAMVLTSVL